MMRRYAFLSFVLFSFLFHETALPLATLRMRAGSARHHILSEKVRQGTRLGARLRQPLGRQRAHFGGWILGMASSKVGATMGAALAKLAAALTGAAAVYSAETYKNPAGLDPRLTRVIRQQLEEAYFKEGPAVDFVKSSYVSDYVKSLLNTPEGEYTLGYISREIQQKLKDSITPAIPSATEVKAVAAQVAQQAATAAPPVAAAAPTLLKGAATTNLVGALPSAESAARAAAATIGKDLVKNALKGLPAAAKKELTSVSGLDVGVQLLAATYSVCTSGGEKTAHDAAVAVGQAAAVGLATSKAVGCVSAGIKATSAVAFKAAGLALPAGKAGTVIATGGSVGAVLLAGVTVRTLWPRIKDAAISGASRCTNFVLDALVDEGAPSAALSTASAVEAARVAAAQQAALAESARLASEAAAKEAAAKEMAAKAATPGLIERAATVLADNKGKVAIVAALAVGAGYVTYQMIKNGEATPYTDLAQKGGASSNASSSQNNAQSSGNSGGGAPQDPKDPKKKKEEKSPSKEVQWTPYDYKHAAPKNSNWQDVVKSTKTGPAKYKQGIDIEKLERLGWEKGAFCKNGKPHKVFKLEEIVGARNGVETDCIIVKNSANVIHGSPITHQEYLNLIK